MNKGFIQFAVLGLITGAILVAGGVAGKIYLEGQIDRIAREEAARYADKLNLGATVLETQLSDTLGTFRTNVNTSLANLNEAISATTSSDPGHTHSVSSSLTGAVANQFLFGKLGGAATSSADVTYTTSTRTFASNGTTTLSRTNITGALTVSGSATFTSSANFTAATVTGISNASQITGAATENIAAGDPVYVVNDSYTVFSTSTSNSFGVTTAGTTAGAKLAQGFSLAVTSTVSAWALQLVDVGTPADNIIISIQTNGSNVPSGTVVVSSTIPALGQSSTSAYTTSTFNTTSSLNASTTYWIVAERSGATSDADYYNLAGTSTPAYYRGITRLHNGTNWTAVVPTLKTFMFDLFLPNIAVERTDATQATTTLTFVGFAENAISANTTGNITIAGTVKTEQLLYTGRKYFLGNGPGTLSLTAGTNSQQAGVAVGTSTLLIKNTW